MAYPLVNQTPKPTEAASLTNNGSVKAVVAKAPVKVEKPVIPPTAISAAPTVTPVQKSQPLVVYHSDDFYKEYIFSHESGNRLNAVNSIGCYGLGQSCSESLRNACPNWSTDLNCQLAFWDSYAIRRYGSWEQSYQFWIGHKWW